MAGDELWTLLFRPDWRLSAVRPFSARQACVRLAAILMAVSREGDVGFPRIIAVASLMLVAVVAPPVVPAVPAADGCSGPVTASFPSQCHAPLTAAQESALKPKGSFLECENCPEMVVVPAGSFTMGSPGTEKDRDKDEDPQHVVTIGKPFAVGKFHVTRDQFSAFVRETGYQASTKCVLSNTFRPGSWRDPGFAQEGSHPVVCVSWDDANAYANWVAKKTGKLYRLLSEAESEYAARGRTAPGTYPRFWFGDDEKDMCRYANFWDLKAANNSWDPKAWNKSACNDGYDRTSPAGHYMPNAFGLYDMAGNAWHWIADCYHDSYKDAPADGSAWTTGKCRDDHVIRGGSWDTYPGSLRAARRSELFNLNDSIGIRLARTLTP
jgi:formylglycine-generating enzyme required for sulfatase activity